MSTITPKKHYAFGSDMTKRKPIPMTGNRSYTFHIHLSYEMQPLSLSPSTEKSDPVMLQCRRLSIFSILFPLLNLSLNIRAILHFLHKAVI